MGSATIEDTLKRQRLSADEAAAASSASSNGSSVFDQIDLLDNITPPAKRFNADPFAALATNAATSSFMTTGLLNPILQRQWALSQLNGGLGLLPTPTALPFVSAPFLNYSTPVHYEGTPLVMNSLSTKTSSPIDRKSEALFNVFVGDLSTEVDDEGLKVAFDKYGSIAEAKVMRDPQSLKSRSYGFVSYWRQEDAAKAIEEMNGQMVGKRAVRTNWATRRTNDSRRTATYEEILKAADGENTSVYVGSIGPEVTEAGLREAFEKFGTVKQIRLFAPKNYGFVVFDSKENAARAILEMSGQEVCGHTINCSWGRVQEQTPRLNPVISIAGLNASNLSAQIPTIPALLPQLYRPNPFLQTWHV